METYPVVWNFKEFYTDAQGVTYALRNDGTAAVLDFEGTCTEIVLAVEDYTLNKIFSNAFESHSSMISIEIPKTVTVIGQYAFNYCYELTRIDYEGTVAEWNAIEKGNSWDQSADLYTVYCNDGTVEKAVD